MPEIELESDIFDDYDVIYNAKSQVVRDNSHKIAVRDTVRKFVNMLSTLDEGESDDMVEAVNYGTTFRAAQVNISPYESMVSGTDNLLDVKFDTNNPARDEALSVEAENIVNQGIFGETEKLDQLWRTICGEGYISGGGPVVYDHQDSGVFPTFSSHLLFPKNTSLNGEDSTYAFEKLEMSMVDLERLRNSIDEKDNDNYLNKEALDTILERLRERIEGAGALDSTADEFNLSVDSERKKEECPTAETDVTVDVWKYWEVRTNEEDGSRYVSCITMVDGISGLDSHEHRIIAQEKEAFKDANEWLTMVIFDEEIGGEKTIDTLRGLAEAQYPASAMIEEFLNLSIEGAMMTAKPLPIFSENADPDEVMDFQLGRDNYAPRGFMDFAQLPNTTSNLNPVVSQLMSTVSGISSVEKSNTGRGQELRQQALERQQNSTQLQTNRIQKAYKKLDRLLTMIFGRLMTLDPEPGTKDYEHVKYFQDCFDEKIVEVYNLKEEVARQNPDDIDSLVETDEEIDDSEIEQRALREAKRIRKELSEKSWGRFKRFRVRATRAATGFDRANEAETADMLIKLLETGKVPSQLIQGVTRMIVLLKSQNVDLADMVAADTEPIIRNQTRIAQREWEAVMRRATLGQVLPTNPDDSHEDHLRSHIDDLISMVNEHQLRPWDQLRAAQFTAGLEHSGFHFQELDRTRGTKGAATEMTPLLQEVIQNGQAILAEVQAQQEAATEGLSDLERAKLEKEVAQTAKLYAETQRIMLQMQMDPLDMAGIQAQREARERRSDEELELRKRAQIVNEHENAINRQIQTGQ